MPLNPAAAGMASGVTGMPVNTSDLLEYPFITLKRFPPGFLHKIGGGFPIFFHLTTKETYVSFSFLGGLVSCRSVKLLEMEEDSETRERDNWWLEIRYGRKITERNCVLYMQMQFRKKRQASYLCSAICMYALEFCKLWRFFF